MTKKYIETIEGKDYEVTVLPSDARLQPARTRERQLFNKLTSQEKRRYIRDRIAKAKKRKRRQRGKS